MNQKQLYNIFYANVELDLMVENIIQNKNGIMVSVNTSIKNKASHMPERLHQKYQQIRL